MGTDPPPRPRFLRRRIDNTFREWVFRCAVEMLKFVQTSEMSTKPSSAVRHPVNRSTSFVASENGFTKATIAFKGLTIPLAWPSTEYFDSRREKRQFCVQILIRTSDGKEIFSRPIENVDRSAIDVIFDDIIRIEEQPPDFCLSLTVMCRRSDQPSAVQTFSRSVGRNVANSLKRYIQSWSNSAGDPVDPEYIENYRNPDRMFAVASAQFRLRNASLSGKRHNYPLRNLGNNIPRTHIIPLLGQIGLVLLVQPSSLISPLAQGTLDMFYMEGGIFLQKLFCVLQGTFLKCYNREAETVDSLSRPDMVLPIGQQTIMETVPLQAALRLQIYGTDGDIRTFIFITGSQHGFLGWRGAVQLQKADVAIWEGFASPTTNPHGAAIPPRPGRGGAVRFIVEPKTATIGNRRRHRRPLTSATFGSQSSVPTSNVPPNTFVISLQIGENECTRL